MTHSISLHESYVSRRAPSNAAGARRGYGRTAAEAHAAAGHWSNQAPFARCRRVTVTDQASPPSMTSRDEQIAWDIVGFESEFVPSSPEHRELCALIRAGKFATAIARHFEAEDARLARSAAEASA